MNPQNNVDSQRSMNNPGQTGNAPMRPGSSPNDPMNQTDKPKVNESLENTNDDMATAGPGGQTENYNEKQDDRKRYDEADPNWRNPDVEMDTPDINPELESNIGPQS